MHCTARFLENSTASATPALVEALEGISAHFVYIHRDGYSEGVERRILAPGADCRKYCENQVVVIRAGRDGLAFSLPEPPGLSGLDGKLEEVMRGALKKIECRCGCTEVYNESTLRLPSSSWEELIDMWSCHGREFVQLKERKISPREGGILYDLLSFKIEHSRLPRCLQKTGQETSSLATVFFNEVLFPIPEECLVFAYLHEEFQASSVVEVCTREGVFSLTYLGTATVAKAQICTTPLLSSFLALKIGFLTISTGCASPSPRINEHFSALIIRLLRENSTLTFLLDKEVSFIFYG